MENLGKGGKKAAEGLYEEPFFKGHRRGPVNRKKGIPDCSEIPHQVEAVPALPGKDYASPRRAGVRIEWYVTVPSVLHFRTGGFPASGGSGR